jgi:hypothetical protein
MKSVKVTDIFKTRWEDLNAKEIMDVINISEKLHQIEDKSSQTYGVLVISMLHVLRKDKRKVAMIDEAQAVDCFNDIAFFRRNEHGEFVDPWLHFPIPGFHFESRVFRAPEKVGGLPMYNLVFDQLVYADAAFSNFCVMNHEYQKIYSKELKKEMDENVNGLIGVLYTPPEAFDPVNIDMHANIVPLKLNASERALILHTYANIRSFIMDRCPNLFPRQAEAEDPEVPAAAPVQTGPMWMNLRYDLAETEAFKGLTTARKALVYDALDYLDKKALESKTKNPNAQS